jgi:Transposase DDE domain
MIDDLIGLLRSGFKAIKDHRGHNTTYALADLLSAGYAIFALKEPSLLAFRENFAYRDANLKRVYGIEQIPADTALREGLDGVDPRHLQSLFSPLIKVLDDNQVFDQRTVLGGYHLLAGDGTQHYCSCNHSCKHCLTKEHRNGSTTYHHQMLAAVWVQPGEKTVFPIAVEPIIRQDGKQKNDCELNAAKRLIPRVREVLPNNKLLLTLDALYGNGPLINALKEKSISFIIAAKEGYVNVQAENLAKQNALKVVSWQTKESVCTAHFASNFILNGQNQDLFVNYFDYSEVDIETGAITFYGAWMTDLEISEENIQELVVVARTRWKVENETFNTLKNQGYHLGHNYGHGKQYLATNFAILTFLAFLIDQLAQHLDTAFQSAQKMFKTKKAFWNRVLQVFDMLPVASMNAIHRFISDNRPIDFPLIT